MIDCSVCTTSGHICFGLEPKSDTAGQKRCVSHCNCGKDSSFSSTISNDLFVDYAGSKLSALIEERKNCPTKVTLSLCSQNFVMDGATASIPLRVDYGQWLRLRDRLDAIFDQTY